MRTSVSSGPAFARTCWAIEVTNSLSVEVKYATYINPFMHIVALQQQNRYAAEYTCKTKYIVHQSYNVHFVTFCTF